MPKKSRNDNPMPPEVYEEMTKYYPLRGLTSYPNYPGDGGYDLHHALIDKGLVKKMPLSERRKIHDSRNLWWVSSDNHASHANIENRRFYYRLLCQRWGKDSVDEFVRSFNWKSTPPVTVEWLESEE